MEDIAGLDLALEYVNRLRTYDLTTNGGPKTWYRRILNTDNKRIWINRGTPSLIMYFVDKDSDFEKIKDEVDGIEIMTMVVYESPIKGIEEKLNGSKAIPVGVDKKNYGLAFDEFMEHFYDKLQEK